ncbi:Mitochondrial carrier protein LEU5 [Wickerhamomyces ciferrii]|uniref:Mitochondrial carrier protein LEU5 n=1 Tax=Wickerhamomyces ciferrii (strain ATCC 14091 / BCRC 22168 / CBS 111 / JCM 3599 / NBRC 0793 / NRRL Y-1031 F-60-10) TaxID=1206466 RepID=K0KKS0_WICCF|nr:Mitochondrial carrier protein LEU5 [Wickerhamomyces ciferrii]CCH41713.1 Mitochondrial carrier protein LEU5 [Wickerhamomyces ciferrii]
MSSKNLYINQDTKLSPIINNTKIHTDDSTPFESKASLDKSSIEYIIKTGLAGGLAGCTGKTLIAPLDRIKILFQTSNPQYAKYSGSIFGMIKAGNQIFKNDGILGFFQGHSATLLRIFPYAAIKFVAYEQVRRILIPNDSYETSIRRLLSGSIAGLCSVFITYPLDLIRVRLAFETKKTSSHNGRLITTIKQIYKEHPTLNKDLVFINQLKKTLPHSISNLTNFYRGFIPTIMGMIPYAGVSFWTHDLIHDIFRHPLLSSYTLDQEIPTLDQQQTSGGLGSRGRTPLNTWAQLLAGGLAGMFSQTAAYPFEVIRRRLQVGGVNNGKFIGIREMALKIWKERGVKGFYVGLSIGYIKVIPMVACSFFVYERTKFKLGV